MATYDELLDRLMRDLPGPPHPILRCVTYDKHIEGDNEMYNFLAENKKVVFKDLRSRGFKISYLHFAKKGNAYIQVWES